MKRRLLILSVLTAMLVAVTFAGRPAEARYCPYYDMCVSMYNDCAAECNNSQICLRYCQQDYTDCQCSFCNLCPNDPPQARLTRDKVGVAVSPIAVGEPGAWRLKD